MEFFTKYKAVIFIVLGALVVIGVWWAFSQDAPSDSLITTEVTPGTSATDKSLVDTLLQLRAVSLNGTIFSDPAFVSLQDFGTQIVPEPVGRPNPFAPISGNVAPATSTSQGSRELFAPRRP